MPSMRRGFTAPRGTPRRHTIAEVSGAVGVGIVGCGAAVCGAVSGKFLARSPSPRNSATPEGANHQIRSLVLSVDLVGPDRSALLRLDASIQHVLVYRGAASVSAGPPSRASCSLSWLRTPPARATSPHGGQVKRGMVSRPKETNPYEDTGITEVRVVAAKRLPAVPASPARAAGTGPADRPAQFGNNDIYGGVYADPRPDPPRRE
jgi:hypothetical protein